MTDTIKRNANGSIDTNYYMKLGRQARSDEAYRLARSARAATRATLVLLRDTMEDIPTMPAAAKA